MNLRIRTFFMALVAMSAASQVYALPSDDSENKEKKEERNVMLNASDAKCCISEINTNPILYL